ncbi:hypothetical protein [Erysipelothrix piscisicarius]|uniref:hypothetical protein n=1 Tax=Erysipelothrix piscisicarius TaxID=2485784 RepID=UPI002F94B33C
MTAEVQINPQHQNHQNIYVIQPEISGTIKHQIIDDGETPVWNDANLKEGVSITLVEKTRRGCGCCDNHNRCEW